MIVHLNYLGYYHRHKTDSIPLKDKQVYKITRIECGFQVPTGWDNGPVFSRVGDCITEDQVLYAVNKNISVDVI
jgi:hypothetical protein